MACAWRTGGSTTLESALTISPEERFVIIGMAEGEVFLFVAYTERDERIRIISARRATRHEQDHYFRQNS